MDDDTQTRSVADRYADLIDRLPPGRRLGLISRLANGFYEGWCPARPEIEDLVALELGQLSFEQYRERERQRKLEQARDPNTPRNHSDYS